MQKHEDPMEILTTLTQTRVNNNEGYAHPQTCDGDILGPRPLLSTARVQPKNVLVETHEGPQLLYSRVPSTR